MIKWNAIREPVVPTVGQTLCIDGWSRSSYHAWVPLDESEWEAAQFYVTAPFTDARVALRLEVTGRTYQWPFGSDSPKCVRVRVEFVGDGEPSTYGKGWLKCADSWA